MLIPLARVVIEAALEAELREHLADQQPGDGRRSSRRNARNGARRKTVRTAIGPVPIEVPRDRWGTYDPLTVGKWQREPVPLDRLLLPLAASGVPLPVVASLLAGVYPRGTSPQILARIAEEVQARLRPWHERALSTSYPVLHVHVHALRSRASGAPALPVVSVTGTAAPDERGRQSRELLSLRAIGSPQGRDAWVDVVSDLRRRQLGGVRWVAGAAAAPFREAAAEWWPLGERSFEVAAVPA